MEKNELLNTFSNLNIKCDLDKLNELENYMNYILKCNEQINLTAIKDVSEFRIKMVLDSALPLKLVNFDNKNVLDIGTGAGFPGVVISILSTAKVTVIDSTWKKINVIKSYPNIKVNALNARAEEFIKKNREKFDVVIARAVAPLNILTELCLPFVKVGGYFIAMKASDAENELVLAAHAITVLCGKIVNIDSFELPNGEPRTNIVIKKVKSNAAKYPRDYASIKVKPL